MNWEVPLLWTIWALYLLMFVAGHVRVRRQGHSRSAENRVRQARASDAGLALQFAAAGLAIAWGRSGEHSSGVIAAALLIWAFSFALNSFALAHLGRQWRTRAVVTDDHELITGGPYRWIRHPVYTAFFGVMAGSVLLHTQPVPGVAAVIIFCTGTEIRVRAEDRLLAEHFGDVARDYQQRVPAWLPPLR